MANAKTSIIFIRTATPGKSALALDLDSTDQAVAMARRLAEQTGKSIAVRDSNGEILEIVCAPVKN